MLEVFGDGAANSGVSNSELASFTNRSECSDRFHLKPLLAILRTDAVVLLERSHEKDDKVLDMYVLILLRVN